MRRLLVGLAGITTVLGTGALISVTSAAPAFVDSQAYELWCPGTPIGTVVINDVTTTASITPASPASGSQFNVTNYQTKLILNSTIAKTAAAIQSSIMGSATASINVTGGTPATLAVPTIQINTPIPNGGAQGVPLNLPASPASLGPFSASGGTITVTQADTSSLTLLLNGQPLKTTCTSYANNANPTGLATSSTASGTPVAPVIATSSSGGSSSPSTTTATTPTTTASTPTTAAPTTPTTAAPVADAPLPTTGVGPGLTLLAYVGGSLIALALALAIFERSRRLFVRGLGGRRPDR